MEKIYSKYYLPLGGIVYVRDVLFTNRVTESLKRFNCIDTDITERTVLLEIEDLSSTRCPAIKVDKLSNPLELDNLILSAICTILTDYVINPKSMWSDLEYHRERGFNLSELGDGSRIPEKYTHKTLNIADLHTFDIVVRDTLIYHSELSKIHPSIYPALKHTKSEIDKCIDRISSENVPSFDLDWEIIDKHDSCTAYLVSVMTNINATVHANDDDLVMLEVLNIIREYTNENFNIDKPTIGWTVASFIYRAEQDVYFVDVLHKLQGKDHYFKKYYPVGSPIRNSIQKMMESKNTTFLQAWGNLSDFNVEWVK